MVLCTEICAYLGQKFGESWVEARKLAFSFLTGPCPPCATVSIRGFLNDMCYINSRFTYLLTYKQIGHCDGTGQAIGAHTGASGQCADKQKQALVLMGQ